MKTELWNGHSIRFVEKDGEWWAVAKDITDALGFSQAKDAVRKMNPKYKGAYKVPITSEKAKCPKTQDMIILNEKGLYRLIMRSNKPEAEEFQDWVYDMLKQLRQASGLEAYQTFHMLDKEFQKNAMAALHDGKPDADQKYYIKANSIANKAVSIHYGLPKMIQKEAMTPEMLKDRRVWLEQAVELMVIREKYHMDFSVGARVYEMVAQNKKAA